MTNTRKLALTAFALLLSTLPLQTMPAYGTANTDAATKPPAPVLIELFTSEGCSSCPAADALLRRLNGTTTAGGQLIIGISEHVTYWNHQGWADPFSSETYTDRQDHYGERFHLESVYTPQMVINGSEQMVGSNEAAISQAINKPSGTNQISLHILAADMGPDALSIHFSTRGTQPGLTIEIMAVLADDTDRSAVRRGENSGRTLTHVAVARSMLRVALLQADADRTVQVPLPASVAASPGTAHHLILFAQETGMGPVLGVDTKALQPPAIGSPSIGGRQ